MLWAPVLVALFGVSGFVSLATARGNGAPPWPWPRGVALASACGVLIVGLCGVALGVAGWFGPRSAAAATAIATVAVLGAGRFRVAWPFARATPVEAAGFVAVGALACAMFVGRPFEMLIGGRDATVYLVGGVALAQGGSFIIHDRGRQFIGAENMTKFYPAPPTPRSRFIRPSVFVKYPGFYFVDPQKGELIAQGLPLFPALVGLFYTYGGLHAAFAAVSWIGVLAVLCVFAAGAGLFGAPAATIGAVLLTLDLAEIWAARYPVAEIVMQMLVFAATAAYVRRDRFGEGLAGALLGAALFARIEAVAVAVPALLLGIVGWRRRRSFVSLSFWGPFLGVAGAALAYAVCLQPNYLRMAFIRLSAGETRLLRKLAAAPLEVLLLLVAALAAAWMVTRMARRFTATPQRLGRTLAIAVGLLAFYGYLVRPHLTFAFSGEERTLVWLSWYVGPLVLIGGVAGFVWFLWSEVDERTLFAATALLTLAALFLQFTFVNVIQIYMTRRYIPAVLPLVFLSFGALLSAVVRRRLGGAAVAWALAAILLAAATYGVVARSRHLYRHREYQNVSADIAGLAERLSGADLVLLSDPAARDLLGPALEFVYGIPTLSVHWKAYGQYRALIGRWLAEGHRLAALTIDRPLDDTPGAEAFDPIGAHWIALHTLAEAADKFPTDFWDGGILVSRYAAGPGSDPLYDLWQRDGERIIADVCGRSVRLLGGSGFLVRRVHGRCNVKAGTEKSRAYLVGAEEAAGWERTLRLYGARFVRRDLYGVVLFDDVSPQAAPRAALLSPATWKIEASDGRMTERLAVDGKIETRWGSGTPQRPEMTYAVEFPEPVDVAWVRVRMGHLGNDRARSLAFATSVDGTRWKREELPRVVDGIFWQDDVPVENSNGDVDLWVNERAVRFVRLINLGKDSRFDWSIAELSIEGSPAR
jgi:hypothetical protein